MIVACDGLPGLPEAIESAWPQGQVQTCVVHLVRGSLRYASKADWSKIIADLKAVYTAPTVEAAEARWLEFADEWGDRYPAIIGLWERSWEQWRCAPCHAASASFASAASRPGAGGSALRSEFPATRSSSIRSAERLPTERLVVARRLLRQ
jgi:Transposase, Mutator family